MKTIKIMFLIVALNLITSGQQINRNNYGTFGKISTYGSFSSGLQVFPNPVTGKYFRIFSVILPIAEIKIINITGKEVYVRKFNNPVQKYEVTIPDVPEGIYLVTVRHQDNSLDTVKILVRNQ